MPTAFKAFVWRAAGPLDTAIRYLQPEPIFATEVSQSQLKMSEESSPVFLTRSFVCPTNEARLPQSTIHRRLAILGTPPEL